ncbi:hypothetical protein Adt_31712 [Abeliophyllum distichum]|uniref:Uncharacterized protein n=1 Tax=Abeliophyllum distichum TaxID=126358 RepID=A0ABD1RG47_9LAMI
MSRVIGSSLDALERRKAKDKKKSKTSSSSIGLVDSLVSSHDLPSQTELPDAAFLVVRKWGRLVLAYEDDGSILLSFPPTLLRFLTQNADLVAKRAVDELAEMVNGKLLLEEEFAGLKESSGAHISSLEHHLENYQLDVEIATRAFLMNEYEKGKRTSWNVDKAIVEYAEFYQMIGMCIMLEE